MLFAALGLFAGLLWLAEWHIVPTGLNAAFVTLFGVLLASVAPAAVYSGGIAAAGSAARVLLFGISVYVFFYGAYGPGRQAGRDAQRAPALLGGRRGGALRLRRFLLPVSRARGIRTAVRLARFRRLPPRARPLLRGQHAGQLLRLLPGDDRRGVHAPARRIAGVAQSTGWPAARCSSRRWCSPFRAPRCSTWRWRSPF